MRKTHEYALTVQLWAEGDGGEFPSAVELAMEITEGLPQEWHDPEYGGWALDDIWAPDAEDHPFGEQEIEWMRRAFDCYVETLREAARSLPKALRYQRVDQQAHAAMVEQAGRRLDAYLMGDGDGSKA